MNPFSLRLDQQTRVELDRLVAKSKLPKSYILRLCIEAGMPTVRESVKNLKLKAAK